MSSLRSPPSVPSYPSAKTPGIYYQRFPRWLFCSNCRRMRELRGHEETGEPPKCDECSGHLVPMRFIAVGTSRGHAMDVPWGRWAHSEPESEDQKRCQVAKLRFLTSRGGSEGLSSLVVSCDTCGAKRDLGDITSRDSLKRIGVTCHGRQPWQVGAPQQCDERLEVLQRGATNVTISETTSALDIPEPVVPVRDVEAEIRQHRNFEDVRSGPDSPRAQVLIELIAEDVNVSDELVRRVATAAAPDETSAAARDGLLSDEWQAFAQAIAHPDEPIGTPNFVVSATKLQNESSPSLHKMLGSQIADVVLVHRLREVRVLHGFRRYDLESELIDIDLGPRGRDRWLPAVESFGEGVLLSLDEGRLSAWEALPEVRDRVKVLERRRQQSAIGSRFGEATPRLVLLHTLAHLLMRQLAFSCGYSAASLRERIYSASGTHTEAGMLIYTAAGDAEGTLGGLVRQGEPPRLANTLLNTLEQAAWCSADPLCRESRGQGLGSLNLAGCHGCCLVAETSCERSNVLLDRVLVVGDHRTPGFFADAVAAIRVEAASRS